MATLMPLTMFATVASVSTGSNGFPQAAKNDIIYAAFQHRPARH